MTFPNHSIEEQRSPYSLLLETERESETGGLLNH